MLFVIKKYLCFFNEDTKNQFTEDNSKWNPTFI
jgi:hypothetical protein